MVQHMKAREPNLAGLALDTNGCFELPSSVDSPTSGIDCVDIVPLSYQDTPSERDAMNNDNQLVHPDVRGSRRYVMGTKLQMRENKTSHKRNACRFHDVKLSKQGSSIKTMNQESLQVVRKFKTIQQGNNRCLIPIL